MDTFTQEIKNNRYNYRAVTGVRFISQPRDIERIGATIEIYDLPSLAIMPLCPFCLSTRKAYLEGRGDRMAD